MKEQSHSNMCRNKRKKFTKRGETSGLDTLKFSAHLKSSLFFTNHYRPILSTNLRSSNQREIRNETDNNG